MSLGNGTYQPATASYLDAGNEIGQMQLYGPVITAANHDAKVTLWTNVLAAVAAIVLGERQKAVYASTVITNQAAPANGAAREIKLLVQGQDVTTAKKLTFTIPTVDPTIPEYVANVNARDVILLDSPSTIVDLITALNLFWTNPETGNLVNVVGLKVVGRNT